MMSHAQYSMCSHTGSDRNGEHTQIIAPDATVLQPGKLHMPYTVDEQDMTVL